MTGDGKAIGTKFGIAFTGKWVWKMKGYIDVGFMSLFNWDYLFYDFLQKDKKDIQNHFNKTSFARNKNQKL